MAITRMGPDPSVYNVIAPQDGGWSLTPMEHLLTGFRNPGETVALELYGMEGVVDYRFRVDNPDNFPGVFHAYFPQARLHQHNGGLGEAMVSDRPDWLYLDEGEYAVVRGLYLERPSFLPLHVLDDRTISNSQMDPLAGVIGVLASRSKPVAESGGADRLGIRMILRPAKEDWGYRWQVRHQQRRDGEDRKVIRGDVQSSEGVQAGALLGAAGLASLGALNWWLWNSGNMMLLAGVNAGLLASAAAGLGLWFRLGRKSRRRPYMNEELVEDKLKSLCFYAEIQLVGIFRHLADVDVARFNVQEMVNTLRAFDDPSGNRWAVGRESLYSGQLIFAGDDRHPFVGGSQILSWLDPGRAKRTVLSAREAASVWHPPLGTDEMASMERTAAGVLVPYLADLSKGGDDSGPLVGYSGDQPIYLPESAIRKHCIILGKSGTGKSTLIKQIIYRKMLRKCAGLDHDAIVVVDPHADLVRDVLQLVPAELVDQVRLLDFGRRDRVPGIHLLDPYLFSDRDRCVDTIITTIRNLFEHWGPRLDDLLKRSLTIIYEYNQHPDTARDQMMTMLDILFLLEEAEVRGSGRNAKSVMSPQQRHILSRVKDPNLLVWFEGYLGWSQELRSEAVSPVHSRMGRFASDQRASLIMGQRESTIALSEVIRDGMVLLASTAKGSVGNGPAALMGGTIVSLVDSVLREQERLPPSERRRCILVCDEFQTVTGADWESMLAEDRKYGGTFMLATQSLARLDTDERKLKDGVLGNVGCIVGYQMSAADARIISQEMDAERVEERFLVNLDPYNCYMRINSDSQAFPAFSMKTLPPPDASFGSAEAVELVLAKSREYTVDMEEIQAQLYAETRRRLRDSSMGAGSVSELASEPPPPSSTPPVDASVDVQGTAEADGEDLMVVESGVPANGNGASAPVNSGGVSAPANGNGASAPANGNGGVFAPPVHDGGAPVAVLSQPAPPLQVLPAEGVGFSNPVSMQLLESGRFEVSEVDYDRFSLALGEAESAPEGGPLAVDVNGSSRSEEEPAALVVEAGASVQVPSSDPADGGALEPLSVSGDVSGSEAADDADDVSGDIPSAVPNDVSGGEAADDGGHAGQDASPAASRSGPRPVSVADARSWPSEPGSVVQKGSAGLGGIAAEAVYDSAFSPDELSRFSLLVDKDPGLRAVVDRRMDSKARSQKQRIRREETAKIRDEMLSEYSEREAELNQRQAELEQREAELLRGGTSAGQFTEPDASHPDANPPDANPPDANPPDAAPDAASDGRPQARDPSQVRTVGGSRRARR